MACKVLVRLVAASVAFAGYVMRVSTCTDPAMAVALQVAPDDFTRFAHHNWLSVLV